LQVAVELKIRWCGTEKGLPEHRLSIAKFGKPLTLLLRALRRTGSNILVAALDDSERGSLGGRLNRQAEGLDLEIVSLGKGSAETRALVTFNPSPGYNFPLFSDFVEQTAVRLINDIDFEQCGRAKSAVARRYLASIPDGVTSQQYAVNVDGEEKVAIEFGEPRLPDVPPPLPVLERMTGRVVGVGFEPGKSYIAFQRDEGKLHCLASPEQVEKAIDLRRGEIDAMVLTKGSQNVLLWIKKHPSPQVKAGDVTDHLFDKWDGALRRLAK
jgi:hypothetical protein